MKTTKTSQWMDPNWDPNWKDPKLDADETISFEHEGLYFHPTIESGNFIRWGKYVFDIREVYKLYPTSSDRGRNFTRDPQDFYLKIQNMLELIGNEPFKNVLSRLYMSPDMN